MEEQENKKTITSSDKLPGCERLTRPEEIKGLSKYLGAIRDTQEEWIEENMPDGKGKLEIEVDRINELPKSKVKAKQKPSEIESLPDAVIGIDDDTKISLPNKPERLHDIPREKIIKDVAKLKVDERAESLPKSTEKAPKDDKKIEIPKERAGIKNDNEPQELPDSVLGLDDNRKISLPNRKIGIGDVIDELSELPDSVLGLDDNRKISLPQNREEIYPESINSLPSNSELIPAEINDPRLPTDIKERGGEERKIKLPDNKEKIYPVDQKILPDQRLRPEIEITEVSDLPDKKIKPEKKVREVLSLPKLLDKPEIRKEELEEYIASRLDSELYSDIISTLSLTNNGKINNGNVKLLGLLSSLLSKEEMSEGEFQLAAQSLFSYFQSEKALIKGAVVDLKPEDLKRGLPDRAGYKLPEKQGMYYADPDMYIRYLAELAAYGASGKGWFGKDNSGMSGWGRRMLLDTTLKTLVAVKRWSETALGLNKDKLPNDRGNIAGKKKIISDTLDPSGKGLDIGKLPGEADKGFLAVAGKVIGTGYEALNSAKNFMNGNIDTIAGGVKNLINSFKDAQNQASDKKESHNKPLENDKQLSMFGTDSPQGNMLLTGQGTLLTIEDLCPKHSEIGTLQDLKDALEKSPYITTPGKVIKGFHGGAETNMTLDTNAYWEVIIEPLCNKDLNGGWSFLPHIHEINAENKYYHNAMTHYDKWIPLSNIELQRSKMTSKSLGLYDGEISYPVSVEYTNELRMTVIDDQYKSWRRYFQKVMDVSLYSSEAHNEKWYKDRDGDADQITRPTAIDKNKFCAAYYKNVTFRVRIYFMTPQYSTIKKFDLLCVMKDFSEEYYGEVEGGGQDLNISFSIVGENPEENTIKFQIDSDGVGSWGYMKGNEFVHLGTNVNTLIAESDKLRTQREAAEAEKNKTQNAKTPKKTRKNNTETPDNIKEEEIEQPLGPVTESPSNKGMYWDPAGLMPKYIEV